MIKIAGLGGKKKPVQDVVHNKPEVVTSYQSPASVTVPVKAGAHAPAFLFLTGNWHLATGYFH